MEGVWSTKIKKATAGSVEVLEDFVVVEEPLEIRLDFLNGGARQQKSLAVTMRTPGHDEELALGFLFTEGIVRAAQEVTGFTRPTVRWEAARSNVLTCTLADGVEVDFKKLERHFYATASCGVCGKASIEAVQVRGQFDLFDNQLLVLKDMLSGLPSRLLQQQAIFDCTGGLHGAALFDREGHLVMSREDVGRHNALDKLIGAALRHGLVPLENHVVLVSGRAGFELVQKSVVAGVPLLAAVGAPSSLSVQLAEDAGLTLVGFLRDGHFNVYAHSERIVF